MRKIFVILFIILFVGLVSAAGVFYLFPYDPLNAPNADDSNSTIEGISEVVFANNSFAIDFYKEIITKEKENVFISPYGIFSALAMVYEGAAGTTKKEMKDVLYFPEDDVLKHNFAAVYNQINKKNKKYELRTGNALWAQQNYPFLEEYFSTVERYYGGKAVNLDFVNEPEESRQTINSFIKKQTKNKIKEILPQRSIHPLTRLILTNAIYFKGDWEFQFDKKDTKEMPFYVSQGNIVNTPIMFMKPEKNLNYLETQDLQILELPYKDKEISMLILLPKEDVILNKIEQELTYSQLRQWISKLQSIKVMEVYLPKFEFDFNKELKDNFRNMGVMSVFENADFSRMSYKNDLSINSILHKSFISVDEKGTTAISVTLVHTIGSSFSNVVFNANRPFIFMIKENQTNNILFLGRVVNPSS